LTEVLMRQVRRRLAARPVLATPRLEVLVCRVVEDAEASERVVPALALAVVVDDPVPTRAARP
jgi:hypothetical protein